MSTSNFWDLTEKSQSEVSRFQGLISKQKEVIKREEAVQSQKGETYICTRAKNSLESHSKKLENAEVDYKRELEKLEIQYRQDKANLEKSFRDNEYKHSNAIKIQEDIIHAEMTKKTPTIIRAETEIASLQEKVDRILANPKNFVNQPQETRTQPLTQTPEPVEVTEATEDDMLRAFREPILPEKPLNFITNSFSYCTVSEAKEINKGMQGLIPAGTAYDTNIYGAVSKLEGKKKVKQPGVKA